MATLAQNISQAIEDFDDIKDAIIAKGVSVPSGTRTSQYASKIGDIQTGITPTGTVQITQNGTVDVTQYATADVNVGNSELAGIIDGSLSSINIPDGVTVIQSYRFITFYNLTSVVMPNTVEHILESAFEACESLSSINFSSSLQGISDVAFLHCAFTTVDLYNTQVEEIGAGAFENNPYLTSLYLPSTVTHIWTRAFADTAITDIYYAGSQADWEQIEIEEDAIPQGVTMHYNYVPT